VALYAWGGNPPRLDDKSGTNKKISLEDIWKSRVFASKSVRGIRSMNDGLHYTVHEREGGLSFIVKYNFETGTVVDTVLRSDWLLWKEDTLEIDDYHFSEDEGKLMIATETESIYRHSTRETNYIWDRSTKDLSLLSKGDKQRYATFSPTGDKVAFVRGNNIVVVNLSNGEETVVTQDGQYNQIINGATDWVYEEEFGFDKAFFWSVNGEKIAYYRFDESEVVEFSMAKYGSLYPFEYKFKYPKAGEDNALVSIHVFDLPSNKSIPIKLEDGFEYIPRIQWTQDPNVLSVQRMNRHQNKLDLLLANAKTGKAKMILTEKRETYVNISDDLTFLKDNKRFIWSSDRTGFNHLYLYDLEGNLINPITKGNWDVMSFLGCDEEVKRLFYMAAARREKKGDNISIPKIRQSNDAEMVYRTELVATPLERHLFSVGLEGINNVQLSQKKGTHRAVFSSGFKYYINYHSSASSPSYITLHKFSGIKIRELEDNSELTEELKNYGLSKKEFFKFKTSEGVQLNGWMLKPSDFDESRKYPVLMYVYGGPGVQTVQDSWGGRNEFWYQMLAQQGYIIVSVDNRGTGARGTEFQKCTYKELGKLETIDQIEGAKYLCGLPYVDSSRIGIWGWSYGGYMTSLCLTKGAPLFKMGIAVAPVTNWRFYDTIYTERYMQTPQENPDGYDDNSPINHVEKLEGKYLLVHGSADDNVHCQNTMEMVNALVDANKQFDLFIYPDKNHGIYGGNTRLHLFTKMTDFILNNL
jgi:dipeptidyl-peptidase-4